MDTVVAGCGYVGSELARRLVAAGHEVLGITRTGPEIDGMRGVAADLTDETALRAALEGMKHDATVFYLASADRHSEDAYRRAYVDGLANVLAMTPETVRLVFASSTAVYGQTDGSLVDETSATEPLGFSGRVMLEAEALARRRGIVVRFGGIYGPGRTRLIDRIRDGHAITRDAAQYRSRIHRDDCAGVMLHLAELEEREAVYIAVDDEPTDQRDVQQWLCSQLGRDPKALAPLAGPARHAGNKRCSNGRLRATGYSFQFPTFREGYATLF